jgi:hypothetical protein
MPHLIFNLMNEKAWFYTAAIFNSLAHAPSSIGVWATFCCHPSSCASGGAPMNTAATAADCRRVRVAAYPPREPAAPLSLRCSVRSICSWVPGSPDGGVKRLVAWHRPRSKRPAYGR